MAGRPVGSENKVNDAIRAQFRLLLERQSPKVELWLEQVAEKDPAKAITCLSNLADFILPRLARQELTGKDGGAQEVHLKLDDAQTEKMADKLVAKYLTD